MKILVMSDSHGKNKVMDKVIEAHQNHVDLMLHCGDIETPEDIYPQLITVRGNNDYYYDYPEAKIIKAEQHRILLIHGNQSYYGNRLQFLAKKALENTCDIVCYGHTHVASLDEVSGITLLNPGSLWHSRDGRNPSYAILTLGDERIHVEFNFL
ncbi:metallophosphoesterase family protein [Dielma fastidiosa]|uniref:metallophosphoesterase family protein n=1 Tax=Dielma fastidiosa TaxID=1034346 RepID=UPI0034AB9FF9